MINSRTVSHKITSYPSWLLKCTE